MSGLAEARSTAEIADRLRRAVPGGDRITAVRQLSGGHSNETYIVEGLNQILRLPPVGALLLESAFDVRGQYAIIEELGHIAGAPPVPVITFFDPSGDVLGAPCFLMERLPGEPWNDWRAPDWAVGRSEHFLEQISTQAIDALAALHGLIPLAAFGPVKSNADELQRWRDSIAGHDVPARLDRLFDQMLASAPTTQSPSPVHGDPKLPNMLWEDGRLTAVLDWELGFNGDPRWDIAYAMMPFANAQHPAFPGFDTPGLWQADRLATEWSGRSGRGLERLHWFEAANFLKVTTIHLFGAGLYARGLSDDTRFKAFGDYVGPFIDYAEPLWLLDQQEKR